MIVLLDSGPLGVLANPNDSGLRSAHSAWLDGLLARGDWVMVSEVADYEVRRSLLRAGSTRGVEKLDTLCDELGVLGLDGPTMRPAAQLWAEARRSGYPTAADARLDADVILAAQARMVGQRRKGDLAIIDNCR